MQKIYLLGILMGLVFVFSGSYVYAYSGGSGTCDCGNGNTSLGGNATDACIDCSAALNDNTNCVNQVNYVGTVEITNYVGTCINNPVNFDNKIFDCQGHIIGGDNTGYDFGIYLDGKSGNTIKNCVSTNFFFGINLCYSSNSTLTNNTANNNYGGIVVNVFSSNNILINNTANNNTSSGFCVYNVNYGYNILINNTANNNGDYGIQVYNSYPTTLINNTANNNENYGIWIDSSPGNTLTNNTVNSNGYYGIYFSDSTSNNVTTNRVCGNQIFDIYSVNSGSTGDNNKCDATYGWNDEGTTGCTYNCTVCSDGTPFGECSNMSNGGIGRPYQCQNGELVPNCTVCGCEPGKDCDPNYYGDNQCHPVCTMGSEKAPEGQCFATLPYFCVNTTTNEIIQNCSECGCQQGSSCQGDGTCQTITGNCEDISFVCPAEGYADRIIGNSYNCQCGWKNGKITEYNTSNAPQCWYNISCNPGTTVSCYHAEGIPIWALITAGAGGLGAAYAFYRYRKRKKT